MLARRLLIFFLKLECLSLACLLLPTPITFALKVHANASGKHFI